MKPFEVPAGYQRGANSLPGRINRADTVYAGGQNQHLVRPWAAESENLHSYYGTAPLSATEAGEYRGFGYFVPSDADPVEMSIRADNARAGSFPGRMSESQTLSLNGRRGLLGPIVSPFSREANTLPGQVARENVVYGGGQYQDYLQPWEAEARGLHTKYGTAPLSSDAAGEYRGGGYFVPSAHAPVERSIEDDQFMARGFPGDMEASHTLSLNGRRRRGGLGGSVEDFMDASCGPWGPNEPVWEDPRDPYRAYLALRAAGASANAPPGVSPFDLCAIGRQIVVYGDISIGAPLSAELDQVRMEAGGRPLGREGAPGPWSRTLGHFARKEKWTAAYMRELTEAGLQLAEMDLSDPSWLDTWAEIRPAKDKRRSQPWYTNPWVLGAGAAVAVGGIWFATR